MHIILFVLFHDSSSISLVPSTLLDASKSFYHILHIFFDAYYSMHIFTYYNIYYIILYYILFYIIYYIFYSIYYIIFIICIHSFILLLLFSMYNIICNWFNALHSIHNFQNVDMIRTN